MSILATFTVSQTQNKKSNLFLFLQILTLLQTLTIQNLCKPSKENWKIKKFYSKKKDRFLWLYKIQRSQKPITQIGEMKVKGMMK
jgi:hypothetical protein